MFTDRVTVLCFTETNSSNQFYGNINKFMPGWNGFYKLANHGLATCFDTEKVTIITEYQVTSVLELLPVLLEIADESVILVLVYRKPGPAGTFIQDLIGIHLELPTE